MISSRDDNRRLHVALVAAHPARTGGMEKFCRFLVREILDAGWQVTVALSGEDVYSEWTRPRENRLDIQRVEWLNSTFAGDRDYTWSTIRRRRKWFRAVRPDVAVFVQSSNTPFRASVAGAALARVPVVTTHRTMPWPVEDPPTSRHFFGLLPGLHLHRRKVVFKTWLTSALARVVVCNSQAVQAGYEQLYGYSHRRTITIPNAVELPRTPQDTTEPKDSSFCTIGYVGRISKEKRLDVLLHAIARMKTARPVTLLMYGDGPERTNLTRLTEELGLSARVIWAGPTQDVWSACDRCDIVALCSPRESSSNMILEAMAAGRATVVTRTGGLPELVGDGQAGICVPPLDIDALAVALDYLVEHEAFRRQIGSRARARAADRHNPGRIAHAWLNVLSAAAGNCAKATLAHGEAGEMPSILLTGATDGVPARQY